MVPAPNVSPARAIAAAVKPFDDLFDTECARRAIAVKIELENDMDSFGIDGVDGQGLLDLGPALRPFENGVEEQAQAESSGYESSLDDPKEAAMK
ncbi:hypothetical protein V1289_001148 [Bradyrhizobium sp. AZCC 2289]